MKKVFELPTMKGGKLNNSIIDAAMETDMATLLVQRDPTGGLRFRTANANIAELNLMIDQTKQFLMNNGFTAD